MKRLIVSFALLATITVHAYDLPTFKSDVTKCAKIVAKLGWAAGMSYLGIGLLAGAATCPQFFYAGYKAFSENKPYRLGSESDPFIFYPDHSYTFRNNRVNSLAAPIIAGTMLTVACGYLAYKAFKSAYNSVRECGQL